MAAAWEAASAAHAPTPEQEQANEAVLALIALGYKQVDAHKLVRDLQERDLPALESEDEPQIDRAPREITGEPARDDVPALLLLHGEGFAGVRVFGRCLGLPRLDGRGTTMGLSLVLHNGPRREAARNGLAVAPVGVEVGGDRFGKLQIGHGGLLRSWVRPQCHSLRD